MSYNGKVVAWLKKWGESVMNFMFKDVGKLPKSEDKDHIEHHFWANFTNASYPVAAAILYAHLKTPMLALGVTLPGIMSSVYHGVGYVNEHEWVVGCLMFLDIVSIVVGIFIGLSYNNFEPSPGWGTLISIMVWEAGALQIVSKADNELHFVWHIISVVPVLLYAQYDLKQTEGSDSHPDNIDGTVIAFIVLNFVIWLITMIMPFRDYKSKLMEKWKKPKAVNDAAGASQINAAASIGHTSDVGISPQKNLNKGRTLTF